MMSSIVCCCYAADYYLVCIPARLMTHVECYNYLQNLSLTVHIHEFWRTSEQCSSKGSRATLPTSNIEITASDFQWKLFDVRTRSANAVTPTLLSTILLLC